jgi:hypothetical protein
MQNLSTCGEQFNAKEMIAIVEHVKMLIVSKILIIFFAHMATDADYGVDAIRCNVKYEIDL